MQAEPSKVEILRAARCGPFGKIGDARERDVSFVLCSRDLSSPRIDAGRTEAARDRLSGSRCHALNDERLCFWRFVLLAPTDWMDTTLGAQYLSRRGWSQNGELRMKPWENATLNASYFGVIDRGIPGPDGTLTKQGGHEDRLFFDALLPDGWRAVADVDQLSSLTFRLAFAETFAQAVNSEVRTTTFLTKNTDGFTLSLAALSYKNFLSASPDTSIDIRTA